MNVPRTELDEKQHIDGLKPDGFHSEEIACQDLLFVMIHQLSPTDGSIANRYRENAITAKNITNG
jgi:hypothetical protein